MEQPYMDDLTHLFTELDSAHKTMRGVLATIDPDRHVYPPWTIKHVLAHIAAWDEATTASLRAHLIGDDPGTPAARGIDHYNAQCVAEREALSYAQVVTEWEQAREQLKAVLRELPPEKFAEPLLFPWGQTGNVTLIVLILAHHEVQHAEEIRALLAADAAEQPGA